MIIYADLNKVISPQRQDTPVIREKIRFLTLPPPPKKKKKYAASIIFSYQALYLYYYVYTYVYIYIYIYVCVCEIIFSLVKYIFITLNLYFPALTFEYILCSEKNTHINCFFNFCFVFVFSLLLLLLLFFFFLFFFGLVLFSFILVFFIFFFKCELLQLEYVSTEP